MCENALVNEYGGITYWRGQDGMQKQTDMRLKYLLAVVYILHRLFIQKNKEFQKRQQNFHYFIFDIGAIFDRTFIVKIFL